MFDPNGEYANENTQDGPDRNPAAIKNVWLTGPGTQLPQDDVVTYGIMPHPQRPRSSS